MKLKVVKIKALIFGVILVPCMSHVSESAEGVKQQQQEAEKNRLREFFSFQLKHMGEMPDKVEFSAERGKRGSLWCMRLRRGSDYSETETLVSTIKSPVCTGGLNCFRGNSERSPHKVRSQVECAYNAGNILLLCAKQNELAESQQALLETVKDCLQVIASGYKVPKNYDFHPEEDAS